MLGFGQIVFYPLLVAFFLGFCSEFSYGQESWKKTDSESRIIAHASKEYISELRKIAELSEGDAVSDYDRAEELSLYMQNRLAEAYSDLLYRASQSPNLKRFLKRVAKTVPQEKLVHIREDLSILSSIASDSIGDLRVQQYVLEQAEKRAKSEIRRVRKSFAKEFETLISEKAVNWLRPCLEPDQ